MIVTLPYGESRITYEIFWCERKTLGITVLPDGSVRVKAPAGTSTGDIEQKVRKRALWIQKQQRYFHSFGPQLPARRYVTGESHLYLGRQYQLRVLHGKPESVTYKGRYFEAVCTDPSHVKDLMMQWYRERAKLKFGEIAEPLIRRFKKYKVEPAAVYCQEMQTRWGSCTRKGNIILNTELIKAPRSCIEYVIIHELCHLIHHSHTREFYQLLSGEMPGWEKWKNKLEHFLY